MYLPALFLSWVLRYPDFLSVHGSPCSLEAVDSEDCSLDPLPYLANPFFMETPGTLDQGRKKGPRGRFKTHPSSLPAPAGNRETLST